jgi:Dyp-type peroxidase family
MLASPPTQSLAPSFLPDVQGIVFSGYGQLPHARYIFFHFTSRPEARAWVASVLPLVTTAEPYPVVNGRKQKPDKALNLAFTPAGLVALGISQETMDTFPLEFVSGIESRSAILGDTGISAPENWDVGGPKNPVIHAMLMAFGREEHILAAFVAEQEKLVERTYGGVVQIVEESGYRHPDQKEHFGFHDGVSQPDIDGIGRVPHGDPSCIKRGEVVLGHLNAYDTYPLSPVVPDSQDPAQLLPRLPDGAYPHLRDLGRNGSYIVYRKLAQDVAGFWEFFEKHAGADSFAMIQLAAKMVGRWPSGAPITLRPDFDDLRLANDNQFDYMPQDPDGYRCPIGSHIRRANPRDSKVNDTPDESTQTSSRHRLVRRALSYGKPLFRRDALDRGEAPIGLQDDGHPRGLHFFSINASITRHFEFVQQTWCDSPTFNAEFETKDPIIGSNDGKGYMTIQGCPVRTRVGNMPRFVTVRGGSYMFMPGLTALRFLSTPLQSS